MPDVALLDVVGGLGFALVVVAALDAAARDVAGLVAGVGDPVRLTFGVGVAVSRGVAPVVGGCSSIAVRDAALSGDTTCVGTDVALVAVVSDGLNRPATAIARTSAMPPTIITPSARTWVGNRREFMGADGRRPEIVEGSKHC